MGISADLIALAALATVVAGIGFGGAALAAFGSLARIAEPHERGALFAAAFVVAYVAFSLPAVIARFAGTAFGLRVTNEVYAVVTMAVAIAALVLRFTTRNRTALLQ